MGDKVNDIRKGENVDITVTAETVSPQDGKVDCYIFGTDPDGGDVIVTVFEDDPLGVDFQEGEKYKIIDGAGEIWDDGRPGVKINSDTEVHKVEDEDSGGPKSGDVNGKDIREDDKFDIALEIINIEYQDDHKVLYYAWCQDKLGDTVILTVFEDNQPERELEEGRRYEFKNVVGERWEDNTPGIRFRHYSKVKRREGESKSNRKVESDSLVIDSVSPERESVDASSLLDRPYSGIALTGLGTSVAILASLLAPDLGWPGSVSILVIGTMVAVGAAYFTYYNPAAKLRQRRQRIHVRLFLELLVRDYKRKVDTDVDINANVMTPDQSSFDIGSPKLSMLAQTDGYKNSEKELEYDVDGREGNCGRAFADGEMKVFDSVKYPSSKADLSAEKEEVTEHKRSILSIPIYVDKNKEGKPTGVLNLDGESPIEETKFNTDEIQNFVYRYTDVISDVLR